MPHTPHRSPTDETGVSIGAATKLSPQVSVAIDIADRYVASARAGQTRGTGTFWVTDEWTCSTYPMPDRPNVANPPQCQRNADGAVVRLGDNG